MVVHEAEYRKSELQKLEEQLYAVRGKKREYRLEYDNIAFHAKYMEQRRSFVTSKYHSRLGIVIGLSAIVLLAVGILAYAAVTGNMTGYAAAPLLFTTLAGAFCLVGDVYFIKEFLTKWRYNAKIPCISHDSMLS